MEDALIQIMETMEVPVYRQGSLSNEDKYPETFLTFWNNSSDDHSHYDNGEYGTSWDYSVFCYSSDPNQTYSIISNLRSALKSAGWIVPSKGFDVASDEATHTGRGLEIYFLETR